MTTLLINILAFATLLSGVFSITSKNPVISVIFLIGTFVSSAGYLILIGINFVGISYIIVYVGAIAVLFLFVIMMINIKLTDILETGSQYTKTLPLAFAVLWLFLSITLNIIKVNFNNVPVLSLFLDKITAFNGMFSDSYASPATFMGEGGFIKMNLINSIVNNFYYSSAAAPSELMHSDSLITIFQQIEALGHNLYTYGAVLLITLSIILLLAMFATIVISRSNKD
jgi:NADH-ubiquinone oxidoreductase chain 6